MKILIAGLGSIGRRHLHNLLSLGERDIVCYRTMHSTLPEDELSGFPVETDLASALAHHPEAVIVSNPTALHLDVAIPAAHSGCHIMLEKPVSGSSKGLEELRLAAQIHGGRILVGYHFRFHPSLRRIKTLLEEATVGRPLSIHAHWGEYLPGWHPWEDYRQGYSARSDLGGGVILTLSHPLDYLRWLYGDVQSLWAFSGKIGELELGAEDNAEIGLRFKNGSFGSLHLDYNQQPPTHRLEAVCTRGTLRWDNADGTVSIFLADAGTWQVEPLPAGFSRNDLYLDEMRHFLQVCRGKAEPLCSLEDGAKALELALAAQSSQELGRRINL